MTWIAGKEECTNVFYRHHVWWNKGNREGRDIKHFTRQDKNLKKGQNLGYKLATRQSNALAEGTAHCGIAQSVRQRNYFILFGDSLVMAEKLCNFSSSRLQKDTEKENPKKSNKITVLG